MISRKRSDGYAKHFRGLAKLISVHEVDLNGGILMKVAWLYRRVKDNLTQRILFDNRISLCNFFREKLLKSSNTDDMVLLTLLDWSRSMLGIVGSFRGFITTGIFTLAFVSSPVGSFGIVLFYLVNLNAATLTASDLIARVPVHTIGWNCKSVKTLSNLVFIHSAAQNI